MSGIGIARGCQMACDSGAVRAEPPSLAEARFRSAKNRNGTKFKRCEAPFSLSTDVFEGPPPEKEALPGLLLNRKPNKKIPLSPLGKIDGGRYY